MGTPDNFRMRAVVGGVIVTGVCGLLADVAGWRTTLREAVSERGVSSLAANLVFVACGLLLFSVTSSALLAWSPPRDESKPQRPWWRRKRVAGFVLLWLMIAYPLSSFGFAYLEGRRVVSGPIHTSLMVFYYPLTTVAVDPFGQPRLGFGWYLNALRATYDVGRRHASPAPLLRPPQPAAPANNGP